jgi:hypothetical protein
LTVTVDGDAVQALHQTATAASNAAEARLPGMAPPATDRLKSVTAMTMKDQWRLQAVKPA